MNSLEKITSELEIDIIGKLIKRTSEEIEELSSKELIGKKTKKELDLLISYNMFLGRVLKLKTKRK